MFSPDQTEVMHFSQECRRSDVESFSASFQRICDINMSYYCGVTHDHLAKVVPSRFLHCKVIMFSLLEIIKILEECTLRLQISCFFSNVSPLIL